MKRRDVISKCRAELKSCADDSSGLTRCDTCQFYRAVLRLAEPKRNPKRRKSDAR